MTDGLAFRRAGPADVAQITAITALAYAKWIEVIGRKPLPMTFDYADLVQSHRIEIASRDGETVGLVELVEKPDHWLIENLAILPAHQGIGIASRLLGHAERLARGQGKSWMRLYTNAKFEANISFYLKRGYAETGREPFLGGIMVHMAKDLSR